MSNKKEKSGIGKKEGEERYRQAYSNDPRSQEGWKTCEKKSCLFSAGVHAPRGGGKPNGLQRAACPSGVAASSVLQGKGVEGLEEGRSPLLKLTCLF